MRATYTQYLVKWLGWGDTHNSWYDVDNLENTPELVQAYEDVHPVGETVDLGARRSMRPRRHFLGADSGATLGKATCDLSPVCVSPPSLLGGST